MELNTVDSGYEAYVLVGTIAKRHRGKVTVASHKNVCSVVWLLLPVADYQLPVWNRSLSKRSAM